MILLFWSAAVNSGGTLGFRNVNSSNPAFRILAESVWVDIKNQATVTKVVQVFTNGSDSVLDANFDFSFGNGDTLVDFALFKNGRPFVPEEEPGIDSAFLVASAVPPPPDSSFESQPRALPAPVGRLVPGETLGVLLVYQGRLSESGDSFRYSFPLKAAAAKTTIGSFAFFATLEEKSRIMGVKTGGYPIVVRGNGKKFRAYFWRNNFSPNQDLGLSYRLFNGSANSKN